MLRLDALSCVTCGLLQVALPAQVAQLLDLPPAVVACTGAFLLVYAAAVAVVSTRRPIPALVAGSLGWGAACVLLLLSSVLSPIRRGMAYVLMPAVTDALRAELQYFGLRAARQNR